MLELNKLYLMDCMEGMAAFSDKFFELAVVDVPYGLKYDKTAHRKSGTLYGKQKAAKGTYTLKDWDSEPPGAEDFSELFRVSKNQVIWGANHFISRIPYDSSCWLIWDKNNSTTSFADCELAWTSFKSPARKFAYTWNGFLQGNMKDKEKRIHPTQKPVALYKWIYDSYAQAGYKILDTHAGSVSSFVAAYDMGLEYVGFEIDPEYHAAAAKRVQEHMSQLRLFDLETAGGYIIEEFEQSGVSASDTEVSI